MFEKIYWTTERNRQQNFDRPNLQVAQQTLTLNYYYFYYYCYFFLLLFYIVIVSLFRKKKVKQKYIFTERYFHVEWYCYGWYNYIWKILVKEFSSRILKEFKENDAFWKTDETFDWPVKYSMKQMHCEIPGVISNNFLSQISDERYWIIVTENTKICKSKIMDYLKACEYFEIKQQDRYCSTINYSKSGFFLKIETF